MKWAIAAAMFVPVWFVAFTATTALVTFFGGH